MNAHTHSWLILKATEFLKAIKGSTKMDASELQKLSQGLRAHKRKETVPDGPSKRARIDAPSSAAPASTTDIPATTAATEVVVAIEVAAPSTSLSPPIEVPSTKKEKGVEKKEKMVSKKVKRKTRPHGSKASDEDLGENTFHN
ncbi:hypothetical protein COCNU_13G007940 [Cocos nucifera]|uniref:Uncharacterized protein n=1 Tax=Cocos nucifera TaxID=13894 RepID=A0A8K0NBI2_COCNU|nr:hypothetical protein COCNU_13G007940 [Cocos nucifera]